MKKLFTLLFGLLSAGIMMGQVAQPILPDVQTFLSQKQHDRLHHTGQYIGMSHAPIMKTANSNPYWLDSIVEVQSADNPAAYKYTYNANNLLEKENINLVFGILQIPYLKLEYTYENDTVLTKRLMHALNFETMDWMLAMNSDYEYNDQQLLSSETNSAWDDSLGVWHYTEQLQFEYNDFDGRTKTTLRERDTTDLSWHNEIQVTLTYDTAQNLIQYIEQQWNEEAGLWVNWNKEVSTYDTLGRKIEFVDYHYSSAMWNPGNKHIFKYNDQQWLAEEEIYSWDDVLHQWYISSKYVQTHDEFGNTTENIYLHWNQTTQLWENVFRFSNDYDGQYSFNNLVLPYESYMFTYYYNSPLYPSPYYNFDAIPNIFSSMLLTQESQRWNGDNAIWETWAEKHYYYSDHLTNTEEPDMEKKIQVYPNPAINEDTIASDTNNADLIFELYNLLGKKMLTYHGTGEHIDISSIPAGAYLYRIDGSTELSGKLLIVK